jgi:hypothetical protein
MARKAAPYPKAPMWPERGQTSVVAPLQREISDPQIRYYNAAQLEDSPKSLTTSGQSSATEPIELAQSSLAADYVSTIRPNEINFLPRQSHTLVAKIRTLLKFRGRGDTVHVEIRQCEILR